MPDNRDSRRTAGIGIADRKRMTLLQTIGQIPLMFMGFFLIVLAVLVVWAIGRTRNRNRTGAV
jgi:uncharacterized membrane protein YqjE